MLNRNPQSNIISLVHDEEKTENIAELLQKSLSLDESTASPRVIPLANADNDENTMLVGSSDSSVEGYHIGFFNIIFLSCNSNLIKL